MWSGKEIGYRKETPLKKWANCGCKIINVVYDIKDSYIKQHQGEESSTQSFISISKHAWKEKNKIPK